jgi:hypothetical protein
VAILKPNPNAELIWASPREVFNVVEADSIGCHIITCTSDIIKKLPTLGKDLAEFSIETVQLFYQELTLDRRGRVGTSDRIWGHYHPRYGPSHDGPNGFVSRNGLFDDLSFHALIFPSV